MFFCDSQKNVDSGNNQSIKSYLYEGVLFLKDKLKNLLE
jgi:hypothetical protein